ncbi:hypothetical protein [Deminuibacter soli]|uniref:DUF559 domain-containing protein n=1 Tax=Deminuibacter soli TaxID=2291815 RepID=A0A3E1NQ61_9BACT|nr:hypothetical protein [Deminuibacter soli]RFM30050.1 hypothetical protein DXN05_03500 [Deminuibacter soli]
MKNWTIKQIEQLQSVGKIRGYQVTKKPAASVKLSAKVPKQVAWMNLQLSTWCMIFGFELYREFRFHQQRKWRFDFALPAFKIGIEYEGLNSAKSRHTTITGFTGDTEKYNTAQALGWRVIRVTVLNYKSIIQIIEAYVPGDDVGKCEG